jgi:formate C-acetyltransferase
MSSVTLEAVRRTDVIREHLRESAQPVWEEPFHEAWMAGEGLDFPVRFARAQAAEMAAAKPCVKPGELVIGNNALQSLVNGLPTPFQTGIRHNRQNLQPLITAYPESEARLKAVDAYWGKWMSENSQYLPITCHASLAWERALSMGLDGMREYVEGCRAVNVAARPGCALWYEGALVALGGISAYVEAHAKAAEQAMAEAETPERRQELKRVAEACWHVAHGRPRSFHEAVQLFYLLFQLCGHDSPGPVDRYLYPSLQQDLESGATSRAEAQAILDCLWLKFEEKTAYGATIGGQLRDGSDASNELSLMCVSSIRRLRLLSPRTALRWHSGLSEELFRATCESIASGATFPALVNDEAVIPAMVERGLALEDAREYTFVGCGQVYPHGRGHGNYEDVVINSAKPLEYVLNNGRDPTNGELRGLETGAADSLGSYEEFERVYRRQMDHHISRHIEWVNERRRKNAGHTCDFLRSLFSYSCVERGLDWHANGTDYSEGMVDMVGLTTVTDSLLAVKLGVFGQKAISLPDLVKILNQDWQDEEALRLFFLRKLPKFGNGTEEVDDFTAAEVTRVNEHIKSHKTAFGGPWGLDIIGWSGAVVFGRQTGATPDGRRRGEALADCAGPAQGRNTRGLTVTLRSVLKLPHRSTHGPMALSLRFPKEVVSGAEGRDRLRATIETYFRGGGQHLQISIASTEDMKAAQMKPEAYRDLMVRVGGFSAYFTQLEKAYQNDMIARSEMGM